MLRHSKSKVFEWVFCYYFYVCVVMIKLKRNKKIKCFSLHWIWFIFQKTNIKKYFFFVIEDFNLIRKMHS